MCAPSVHWYRQVAGAVLIEIAQANHLIEGACVQNKAARLSKQEGALRSDIQRRAEVVLEKQASLAALRERHADEAATVTAGSRRCSQYAASLRSVEANRDLRASLLSEKEELILSLNQELGQVHILGCPLHYALMDFKIWTFARHHAK